MLSEGNSFSALQKNLELAYSNNVDDQEVAAMNLAKLVGSTMVPTVSFAPLAHALCKLLPSPNMNVAKYAASATKILLLEDSLRPQVNVAGLPTVICSAVKSWEDELSCLRELLAALQTLCWDKNCIRSVIQADKETITHLIDYIQASDQEVAVLALSSLCNILAFCDTILLQEDVIIDSLKPAMPILLEICNLALERPQKFYAAAAIANAAAHPRLAEELLEEGGLLVCRELEAQSISHLHIMGSRLGDCAQTALYLLSNGEEGERTYADAKYSFKWGTQPTMDLQLVSFDRHNRLFVVCACVWVMMMIYTFSPALF
jgi:hypothetical protein